MEGHKNRKDPVEYNPHRKQDHESILIIHRKTCKLFKKRRRCIIVLKVGIKNKIASL